MFHKHNWKEISRTFAKPPGLKSIEVERMGSYFANKVFFGLTTILWECEICQELRREELLGKEKGGEVK